MEDQETTVAVRIPKSALIDIAACGRMGTGEVLMFTRHWAERACLEAGLKTELDKVRAERLEQNRANIRNLLGDDMMTKIDSHIKSAIQAVTGIQK